MIQGPSRCAAIFNMKQVTLAPAHEVWPARNNCGLKDLFDIFTLFVRLHHAPLSLNSLSLFEQKHCSQLHSGQSVQFRTTFLRRPSYSEGGGIYDDSTQRSTRTVLK